jgi:hypothetical protein
MHATEPALFAWLISHQPAVLFSQNKPATSNQPAVFFSQNKPAPGISHQPTEQARRGKHCIGGTAGLQDACRVCAVRFSFGQELYSQASLIYTKKTM